MVGFAIKPEIIKSKHQTQAKEKRDKEMKKGREGTGLSS